MTEVSVEHVIKQLVLANADNEIKSIIAVVSNSKGEPELHLALNHYDAYRIIAGLRIMEHHIINNVINNAGKPLGDRE